MKNLAIEFLKISGEGIERYSGLCGELADDVLQWAEENANVALLYMSSPSGRILYAPEDESRSEVWCYHTCPIINGYVHDAWHPDAILPPSEYIKFAFPDQDVVSEVIS